MRSVLAISMPASVKQEVIERAQKAGQSVSGYILHTITLVESMISEDELLAMAREAEADYKKGKTKKLKSLADLMK